MGLDYSYTCTKINKEIGLVKSTIEDHLKDFIEQLCPLMSADTVLGLRSQWANEMYDNIESAFETVRETNEDMRKAAEYQIGKLEEKISELEGDIKTLEREIEAVS